MSKKEKRDAEAAFEARQDENPHSSKRRRRSRKKIAANDEQSHTHKITQQTAEGEQERETLAVTRNAQTEKLSTELAPLGLEAGTEKPASHKQAFEVGAPENGLILARPRKSRNKRKDKTQEGTTVTNPKRHRKPKRSNGWLLSQGTGGAFLPQDPLLVDNGQYLIIPTHFAVYVYSASTSLLVRTMHLDEGVTISTCAMSVTDPAKLIVATEEGKLLFWNWKTGRYLTKWQMLNGSKHVTDLPDESMLCVYSRTDGVDILSKVNPSGQSILLERPNILADVRVFDDGGLIVLCSADNVIIGHAGSSGNEQSPTYTWREFNIPGSIASFDVKLNEEPTKTIQKTPTLDIVIGSRNGAILIYDDILNTLIRKERNVSAQDNLGRRFHWHRQAVNSVKWSKDGNYVVSGGEETVLVIWQLDTNQKQFLPHLSSPILNITISSTGSAYGIRLADNSVMVLSTADLLPSTNIVGLGFNQRDDAKTNAILHPVTPDRLLAAVPTSSAGEEQSRSSRAGMLQTFDINTNLQVGRQAMARNLTTVVNVAPDGFPITEPNVSRLQISHDGKWLATVDVWIPPKSDLDVLYLSSDEEEARRNKAETCLRFWTWNEEDQNWELVTRIDEPHLPGPQSVLSLAVHPTNPQFATIGADAIIRTWTPRVRLRDGLPIRNAAGDPLYTWTCSKIIPCHSATLATSSLKDSRLIVCLAYSDDGSVLAASLSRRDDTIKYVHLIDTQSGKIALSQPDLLSSGESKIVFAGRYLVCLSHNFIIFDIVTAQTIVDMTLNDEFHGSRHENLLVSNTRDNTFALGLNRSLPKSEESTKDKGLRGSSLIAIFNTAEINNGPISIIEMNGQMRSLLASPCMTGYTVIDDRLRIRRLTGSGTTTTALSATTSREPDALRKGLDSIFGTLTMRAGVPTPTKENDSTTAGSGAGPKLLLQQAEGEEAGVEANDGGNNNARRSIEEILNIQSSAQAPTPGELFDRIAALFAKPASAMNTALRQ